MKFSTILVACISLALTLVATSAASPVYAGGIDANIIPAKAQLVGHVDLDELRSSELAKSFATELDEAKKQLGEQLKDEGIPLSVDDFWNAGSITFWAEGDDTEKGAMIISGIDGTKFARAVKKLPKHKSLGSGLHKIDDTFVGIKGSRIVVADDRSSINATLKVLGGGGKSIAQTKKAKRLSQGSSVFFLAAFDKAIAKKIKQEADSAIFNNVSLERGVVTIAEKNKSLIAKAVLETTDSKGADQLHKLAAGAISFFSVASDSKELGKLLDGVDIKSSGSNVTFTITLPISQLKNLAALAK